ncbi:hypothetical protein HS088_TW03G00888 [Tripterygium wilfordii]|uniref:RRM domain-containing protein n=1 Tax=Tripterygium wilfordii TaxID=458696 RepID=A0A7J7DVZ9_TRIWF|nr:hypothetical protein HS088_TW03G00888 [Tripterygium wilfordii]
MSITNMPEDLRGPFGRFGHIKDIDLPRDYYTGEPRGFGFVQFVDPADAADANHSLDGEIFLGRELMVVFAEENWKKPSEMRARDIRCKSYPVILGLSMMGMKRIGIFGCGWQLSCFPDLAVSSSAEYIIQHFTAATGCRKLEGRVKNIYVTGKVTMAMVDELGGSIVSAAGAATVSQRGCFVMWQMVPDKWLIELVVGGHKVVAGSDGSVAWRHTPWISAHAAKGGVRPLRRAIQASQYTGEKEMSGVDCFVLKLSADQRDLADRSDNTAEMIKHVMFGEVACWCIWKIHT